MRAGWIGSDRIEFDDRVGLVTNEKDEIESGCGSRGSLGLGQIGSDGVGWDRMRIGTDQIELDRVASA